MDSTTMPVPDSYGRRLLASMVDHHAQNDPHRVWASFPIRDDPKAGFRDITYKEFAEAIARAAWWLDQTLGASNGTFETFAYSGDKDVRYPILAVAAVKVGRKILVPSPFTTREAQLHLLKSTECRAYLYTDSFAATTKDLLKDIPNVISRYIPEAEVWLDGELPAPYAYNKTWEEGFQDPWVIFHTSGTTGLPKPIVYTNETMAGLDAAKLMPDAHEETIIDQYSNGRWHSPVPSLHMVGMTMALQFTVFLGAVFVYGAAKGPPTAERVAEVLKYGNVKGTILPPSVIEEMSKNPHHLDCLKRLTYVQWAGAPLSKSAGDLLVNDVELMPCMGSTEAGAWFPKIRKDREWNYYTFRESMGIEFQQRTENDYEVVFVRKPQYAQWQQIFRVYPDLADFCTKDLFVKHSTKENLWEYVGRLDDMINFADGQSLRVAALEETIQSHPNVRSALIGGEKRPWPFLIIEPIEADSSNFGDKLIDEVWPPVARANELCLDGCHMQKGFTLLTKPSKPMPRTAKGTVARREAAALYEEEVEAMYKAAQ